MTDQWKLPSCRSITTSIHQQNNQLIIHQQYSSIDQLVLIDRLLIGRSIVFIIGSITTITRWLIYSTTDIHWQINNYYCWVNHHYHEVTNIFHNRYSLTDQSPSSWKINHHYHQLTNPNNDSSSRNYFVAILLLVNYIVLYASITDQATPLSLIKLLPYHWYSKRDSPYHWYLWSHYNRQINHNKRTLDVIITIIYKTIILDKIKSSTWSISWSNRINSFILPFK